jgi:hypothetical protein
MTSAMYDSSFLTKRRRDKAISDSFLNRIQNATNPTTGSAPLLGISQQSIINHVNMGQMSQYRKSDGGCTLVSPGCPCGPASVAPAGPCIVDFNSYWATNIISNNVENAFANVVSPCGNVYVVGYYVQQTTFNNFSSAPPSSGAAVGVSPYGTITAPSGTPATNEFTYVVKYDVNGVVQWVTHLGPVSGTGSSPPYGVAIDANENVYVTGYHSASSNTNLSIYSASGLVPTLYAEVPYTTGTFIGYLVKYDTNGQALWATKFDTSGNGENRIAVDAQSNVYLTGYYTGSLVISNYQSVSSGPPPTITFSSFGTIAAPAAGQSNGFVLKYNSAGTCQWATTLEITTVIPGNAYTVQGNGIAVDSSGNVYVIGNYSRQTTSAIVLQINNASGTSPTPYGTFPSVTGIGQIFLVKYNTNGQVQWATSMDGLSNNTGNAIALDSSGNVYITGMLQSTITFRTFGSLTSPITLNAYGTISSTGSQDAFVAKYSSNGQSILWATKIGRQAPAASSDEQGTGIAVDTNGNAYVCGYTSGITSGTIMFWSFGSQGVPPPSPPAINLNANNYFSNFPIGKAGFLVKYDTSGTVQWATSLTTGNSTTLGTQPTAVSLDPNGNPHISGFYSQQNLLINNYDIGTSAPMTMTPYGTLSFTSPLPSDRNVFLVKYNSSGQVI